MHYNGQKHTITIKGTYTIHPFRGAKVQTFHENTYLKENKKTSIFSFYNYLTFV